MSLAEILSVAERRRKKLLVYAPEETELLEQFAGRNVVGEHRSIPADGPEPFVIIRNGSGYRGAISIDDFEEFLSPTARERWDLQEADPAYQALLDLLDDTLFAAMDRRQLLATSLEFEDRAWRAGYGRLAVGFQTETAFRKRAWLYRELRESTDLDINIYVRMDTEEAQSLTPGATIHNEPTEVIDEYWFMLFDGHGEDIHKWGLVARQIDEESYNGAWTFEPELVDAAFAALE